MPDTDETARRERGHRSDIQGLEGLCHRLRAEVANLTAERDAVIEAGVKVVERQRDDRIQWRTVDAYLTVHGEFWTKAEAVAAIRRAAGLDAAKEDEHG